MHHCRALGNEEFPSFPLTDSFKFAILVEDPSVVDARCAFMKLSFFRGVCCVSAMRDIHFPDGGQIDPEVFSFNMWQLLQ